MEVKSPLRVAVVGSGMAGLVTAYLLQRDTESRYAVMVFEKGDVLALDSASLSMPNRTRDGTDRVDLPMRAFAGGFYNSLQAMYDYLEVDYRPQQFLFNFWKLGAQETTGAKNDAGASYFVHASNNHCMPPPRPNGIGIGKWLLELVYLLVCYTYFTCCCFLVAPHPASTTGLCESLDSYLQRIRLPRYFVTFYLLPLLSSVTTCSPTTLLAFPAIDIVDYKRRTHGAPHYTVTKGVQDVQNKLSRGLDTRLAATVTGVEPAASGVRLRWSTPGLVEQEQVFDRVVLAVSPDIVGRIFAPLSHAMARIPTVLVDSIIHNDCSHVGAPAAHEVGTTAQTIHIRSATSGMHLTESVHVQPSGALVTTCPITPIDPSLVIKHARFTRVLRSVESSSIINSIFGLCASPEYRRSFHDEKTSTTAWQNGDDRVWLVGGWCWDGMVLLEGCVVSAMRVARTFEVEIPWIE